MGPKVLFQIGLAILKINGEELLDCTDDGQFIRSVHHRLSSISQTKFRILSSCMRTYFASLGDSAHPHSSDPQARQITNFQELLVVSFREFGIITEELIHNERKRFKNDVVDSIENFAKRAQIRNLKSSGEFDKLNLGRIFDNFQLAGVKYREWVENNGRLRANLVAPTGQGMSKSASSMSNNTNTQQQQYIGEDDRPEIRIEYPPFKFFIAQVATWGGDIFIVKTGFMESKQIKTVDHDLIGG